MILLFKRPGVFVLAKNPRREFPNFKQVTTCNYTMLYHTMVFKNETYIARSRYYEPVKYKAIINPSKVGASDIGNKR